MPLDSGKRARFGQNRCRAESAEPRILFVNPRMRREMPAAAVRALVYLQSAPALAFAPGEVLLRVGARGVAILRFAGLVALRGALVRGRALAAGILASENVVKGSEVAELRVELRLLLGPRRSVLPRSHRPP